MSHPSAHHTRDTGATVSILLIEDNPGDARLFDTHVEETNLTATLEWVSSLEEGLASLRSTRPDVIVTDLGLPDSEGTETVSRIEEVVPGLPLVVLTGQQSLEMAMEALDAGATEFLRKDELMPGLVERTVQGAIERKRTERALREREQALRESRERYRSLFQDSSDAILVHDAKGRIQEINPQAESLFCLGSEELQGRSIESLLAEDGADPAEEKLAAVPSEHSYRTEARFQCADGSTFWGELSANTIQIGGKSVVRTLIRDVTERKDAERALRESEERHRALANSIPGVAYQFAVRSDGSYGFNFLSDRAEELLGLPSDSSSVFRDGLELIPSSHRSAFLESIEEAVENETAWQFETPVDKPSGERIWVLAMSSPPERRDGELAFTGVLLDVTERKEAERALRRSRDRLALQARMLDEIGQAVIATDGRGEITYWNSAAERIYGWTEDEALGRRIMDLTVPDDTKEVANKIMAALGRGETWTGEFEAQRKDGSTFPAIVSDAPIQSDDGDLLGVIGVTTDITEQKRREQQLRARERQLEQIRDNVTEVVWMSTPEKDRMEFITQAYETIWGRPAAEVEANPTVFLDGVHPDDRDRVRAALDVQKETPEAYEETYRVVQPDGGIRWVHDRASGVYDENGDLVRIVGIATDVTAQRRREEALEDRQEKMESLYRTIHDLLAAESRETVAASIHDVLDDLFDFCLIGVDLIEKTALVPEQATHTEDLEKPPVGPRPIGGTSLSAQAFRSGETKFLADLSIQDSEVEYGNLDSGASIPLGRHGVVNVGQVGHSHFDRFDVRLIEVLAAHAATVLDRIEREEDLREERDLLDRIFETSPATIVVFNAEGDFVQASGRAEEVLGLERSEITDRTYNDPEWHITKPDGSPMPDEELPFARVMETGEPVFDAEHTIIWPNGRRRLLSVSGAPLRTADGSLEGAVFHIDDITERRAAERALRRSEERFRGIFENAAIGIAVLDDEGQMLEVNPALAEMTGYAPDELQGEHFERVTHPADVEEDRHLYETLVAGNRDGYQIEKRYVRKDGDVFWGRLTVSRHRDGDDQQVIGMVENIDDQKHYENTLQTAKERAEEASRLKSAMLANMSHEIRTPLTAVTGFSELLVEQLSGQPKEFATRIMRSGQRLMKTLDSVLQLSKLEAGGHELETESVCLDAVVSETVDLLASTAEEKSITLETSLPDQSVVGPWNEGALNRIVENLLNNAIKFTPDGGRVELRIREEDDEAVLEVEDTGIGIDVDALPHIFEAFKQESEGMGREYEGSGLGLSIVKRLTDVLGGHIDVESEKGRGSCFTVRLPLERPS